MAKFGWRDGKLWAKDLRLENAPQFMEVDGTDILVYVGSTKRKIETVALI